MVHTDDTKFEIVTIQGKKYLTFPDSVKFTGIKRETLQQQINRKTLQIKKIGKYNFVQIGRASCRERV